LLSREEVAACEGQLGDGISAIELALAPKQCQPNKAPGSDGWTCEFYSAF